MKLALQSGEIEKVQVKKVSPRLLDVDMCERVHQGKEMRSGLGRFCNFS